MDFSEDDLIPGIYNYCDRWCEKCTHTKHCRIYRMEHQDDIKNETTHELDLSTEDFWKKLSDVFEKTIDLIHEHADEIGIDISKIKLENIEIKEHIKSDLEMLAGHYSKKTGILIKKYLKKDLSREALDRIPLEKHGIVLDSMAVIEHYSDFISVKMMRAFTSLELEQDLNEEHEYELNDHLGTAKICIISIERSLKAFSMIYDQLPELQDDLIDFMVILSQLKEGMLDAFPTAMDFIRPGLDE